MAPSQDTPAIRVRDLVVGFGEHMVLDHLSLDVRKGEIWGSLGDRAAANRSCCAPLSACSQSAMDRSKCWAWISRRQTTRALHAIERRWGVLFQQGALFSSLTALQNVQFPMRENLGLSEHLLRAVALAKLEMVGLDARDGDKLPSELSGGMTKRVALARALALDPELVFLDEPTSGLDPIAAGEFDELIRTLQQTLGLTVFMVTHDLESLRTVCDRIAALADGKVIAIGTMADMRQSQHLWMQAYFQGKRGHMLERVPSMTGA